MTEPALLIAIAMVAGVSAQAVARKVRLPEIVLLLATGVALGPDAVGLLEPDILGHTLHAVVGFGVAVILFEGGLNQDIALLRRQATSIRRLVLVGPFVTATGGGTAAHWLLGWEWPSALLFGTLVIVTGPTVITPLLRRIRVKRSVTTILEAEGVFGDAVGAVIAFAALELCLYPSASGLGTAATELGLRVAIGASAGGFVGWSLVWLLGEREWIPPNLRNIFALSAVIAAFEICNYILGESGIVAAIVAGMVVGNSKFRALESLVDFKEQLTSLLLAILFVLLAADVRVADVVALGWRGLGVVAILMFLVRPLQVLLCTAGAGLTRREKLFVSWIAPRGIVAAAIASLFAQRLSAAGIDGGTELRALVFMTIVVTVVVQGLSASRLSEVLRLERPPREGVVIIGANAAARAAAIQMMADGFKVVLIDTNEGLCRRARRAGLPCVHGDAMSEATLDRIDIDHKRAVVALTRSSKVNYFALHRMSERSQGLELWALQTDDDDSATPEMFDNLNAKRLQDPAYAAAAVREAAAS